MKTEKKAPTWDELEWVVNDNTCSAFLMSYPSEYRKALALALAIARWRPERRRGARGEGSNGLCAYDTLQGFDSQCPYCPLRRAGEGCYRPDSLHRRWSDSFSLAVRERLANEMYNLLCKLYKEEYDRC